MENFKFILFISLMGLYVSWGFYGCVMFGMFMEVKVNTKTIDPVVLIFSIMLIAIIYIGLGYILATKHFFLK